MLSSSIECPSVTLHEEGKRSRGGSSSSASYHDDRIEKPFDMNGRHVSIQLTF